jgi:predicted DNA-binding WGR domain protein
MQLIQRKTLLYQSDSSDKVYEVDLCQIEGDADRADRYVVNFRYGRRGKSLREGVQTDKPVPLTAAQKVFNKLVNSKTAKGYRDATEPSPEAVTGVAAASVPSEPVTTPDSQAATDLRVPAILARLERGLQGDDGMTVANAAANASKPTPAPAQPDRFGPSVTLGPDRRTIRINLPALQSPAANTPAANTPADRLLSPQPLPRKNWSLDRVIWRAGELKIQAAAPLLIQLLTQSLGANALGHPPLRIYSLAWALGRCGDPAAIAPLEALFNACQTPAQPQVQLQVQPHIQPHIQRIVLAALLKLSTAQQAADLRSRLLQSLPSVLQPTTAVGPAETFATALGDWLANVSAEEVLAIDTLYQINNKHIRPALLQFLRTAPFRPPYFQCLRHIFKLAEYNQDGEVFGLLAHRFEQEEKGYHGNDWVIHVTGGASIHRHTNQRYNQQTRRWEQDENPAFAEALSGPNAQAAFSEKTKNYLRRRTWRSLQRLGDLADPSYIPLATEVLLCYSDEDAQAVRSNTYYRWDRNWRRVESGRATWDQYAAYLTFNHLLYTHSPRYSYKAGQKAWRCQADYAPGGPVPIVREEAFPRLWEQQPEFLLRLLMESRCLQVHEFAVKAMGVCAAFCDRLSLDALVQLLRQPYPITAEFAFGLARSRYQANDPNFDLVLAVANCAYAPARAAAYDWIAAQRDRFLANASFVAALIVSAAAETRAFARQLLGGAALLDASLVRIIVGQTIAILLVLDEGDGDRAQFALETLQQRFADPMRSIGLDIILDLLRRPLASLQVFGASLLLHHQTPPADLPTGLLDALLESPTDAVRVIGVQLLGRLPDEALLRQPELLLTLATHALPQMRVAIRPTLVRLLGCYGEFVDRLIPILLLELQHPEPHEGVHNFIVQLLGQDVTAWMAQATLDQTWQLLATEFSPAQALAGYVLQSQAAAWSGQLTVTQLGELTHHEVQSVRAAGCQMIQLRLPQLRSNPDDLLTTVMVLESKWEDAQAFGFQFFSDQLQPEDFTPSLIVSVCDNNLPEIRKLGRDLLGRCFQSHDGQDYLLKFSEHPAQDMQLFATNYLERYATDRPDRLIELQPYFISVLGQVNRNRVAKQRIFQFLAAEATKGIGTAQIVTKILMRQSLSIALRDKSQAIEILLAIRKAYPDIETPLHIKPVAIRTSIRAS